MKNTIKLSGGRAIVVAPQKEGVRIDVTFAGVVMAGDVLSADQVGVLLFALETAADAVRVAQDRAAAGAS